MARHRTRRELMATQKNHNSSRGWNKGMFASIIGILICTAVVVYFAYSAPSAESQLKTRESSNEEWHQMKQKWSLEPLTDHAFELVCNAVKIERLNNEFLRHLMVVRIPGTESIVKVKNFLADTMTHLGWDVEENSFLEAPPKSYSNEKIKFTNVIATLNPLAKRRLVLACHYDSKVEPDGFLGATDSAVPCAMMLEIAKSLSNYTKEIKQEMELTIQFLFFDGEEAFHKWTSTDSLYGSRHLAQKWHAQSWPPNSNEDKNVLDAVDLFVLLDLLGEKDPTFYEMDKVRTRHFKELIRIEKRLNVGKTYFQSQVTNWAVEDDHVPFLKKRVPIMHIIPTPFPDNWHKITDNGDNLDDKTINKLTKMFAVFVAEYLHLEPKAL